ncbi:hypothetical protein BDQ17DRAFT_1431804 [Cyathus striatus]|nr:hypothetical protein BDQ17DRAFT_1431804 [Cyathus striatus]
MSRPFADMLAAPQGHVWSRASSSKFYLIGQGSKSVTQTSTTPYNPFHDLDSASSTITRHLAMIDHWRTAGNDTATSTSSTYHSSSKLHPAQPHNMDSTGAMFILPIRSSSLPLLPDLHPRPHPTRSHTDPSPSRPPQLPPLSIPPPFASNILDPSSRDEDCSFTFSSPPSSPSSPLLHTRFSVSKLSLATDSESLFSKCSSSPADNTVSDDPSQSLVPSLHFEASDLARSQLFTGSYIRTEPSLRSWFPRSLTSRSSTESYVDDLDTPVPKETTSLTQQPPKHFPSISSASSITPLPTSSQSALISASNSVLASTFSAPTHTPASLPQFLASTPPPASLPSTPDTPAFSRRSTPPPLSLPVTPPSFSRRSSLVRAQSTPAIAPSFSDAFRLSRRRAFTTHSTSTPTPSTSKRFVSAVRVVMRDIKGFAMGRRVKSPEREDKNIRVSSLLDRSSSRSGLYRVDTVKLARGGVDRDWRRTFAQDGVIGV